MLSNYFNTTPSGTTIININDVINLSSTMIINSTDTPYIDNIILLNPSITTFIFEPGNYKLINILKINVNNIKFIGHTGISTDVYIEQTMNFDGILLQANNIVLQSISVKCTFAGKNSLIVASANNTLVAGCYFYCSDDTFGIYYAGPSMLTEGKSTLDAYFNYELDTGNIFYNNVVYSKYSGDSVSFSLQYNSKFVYNFIRGGKVAIYMCRSCNIYNNKLMNSTTHGIYISLPSDNLNIICNKICDSTYSGIVMKNQLEHGVFLRYDYNIIIKHNTIFGAMFYGIEINNANDVHIDKNNIIAGSSMAIYAYDINKLKITYNKIAYFTFAVFLENSQDIEINHNNILSEFPNIGQNGIKITSSINTNITNNNVCGKYVYDLIADNGINTVILSNNIIPYYTITDERYVFDVI